MKVNRIGSSKITRVLIVTIFFVVAVFGGALQSFAAQDDSSLKTTDSSGNAVNNMLYETKQDVFIRFGSALSAGTWEVVVSAQGGGVLGTGTVVVEPGDYYRLWDITPYSNTTNNAGNYKVDVSYLGDRNESKSDTFKVKESAAQEKEFTVSKDWIDEFENPMDAPEDNWEVTIVVDSDSTYIIDGTNPSKTFSISSDQSFIVSETVIPEGFKLFSGDGTYDYDSSSEITVVNQKEATSTVPVKRTFTVEKVWVDENEETLLEGVPTSDWKVDILIDDVVAYELEGTTLTATFDIEEGETFVVQETMIPEGFDQIEGDGTYEYAYDGDDTISVVNQKDSETSSDPEKRTFTVEKVWQDVNGNALSEGIPTTGWEVEVLIDDVVAYELEGSTLTATFDIEEGESFMVQETMIPEGFELLEGDGTYSYDYDGDDTITVINRLKETGSQPGNGNDTEPDGPDNEEPSAPSGRGGQPISQSEPEILEIPEEEVALDIPEDEVIDEPKDEPKDKVIEIVPEEEIIIEDEVPLELPKTGVAGGGLMTIPLLLTLSGYAVAKKRY